MASSSKPRKKYNPVSREIKQGDEYAARSFVVCIHTLGKNGIDWVLNGRSVKRQSQQNFPPFQKLFCTPRKWSFVFGLVCRNQEGVEYLSFDFVKISNQFTFEDLDSFINKELDAKFDTVNKEHIISPFFIASPEAKEFSDDEVIDILAKRNASRGKTLYEINRLFHAGLEELSKISFDGLLDKLTIKVLHSHNIFNLAQIRTLGTKALGDLKGIGEKRQNAITNMFFSFVLSHRESLPNYLGYETAIAEFEQASKFLESKRNHAELI